MTVEITKDNFEEVVLKNQLPVLVDFWATWCGPCKMIGPIIEELSEELEGKVVFGKLNVDKQPELAMQFQVMSIPTLILFNNGEITNKKIGFMQKEKLVEMLGL
ncbi:MAG: thioredoxin [Oscillospiraceae bacterium]|nr:thioredoxin [Oscillospiraceae bacterium]